MYLTFKVRLSYTPSIIHPSRLKPIKNERESKIQIPDFNSFFFFKYHPIRPDAEISRLRIEESIVALVETFLIIGIRLEVGGGIDCGLVGLYIYMYIFIYKI